jgi:hypothetical protein
MKMWALIGYGPNDVAIPALLWTDKEKALNACIEIFGSKPKISGNSFKWEAEKHEFPRDVLKKMYISYYGGCGECYLAELEEVKEGVPFVCFNLD